MGTRPIASLSVSTSVVFAFPCTLLDGVVSVAARIGGSGNACHSLFPLPRFGTLEDGALPAAHLFVRRRARQPRTRHRAAAPFAAGGERADQGAGGGVR